MKYVLFFENMTLDDVSRFGGKNASLGQMIRDLSSKDIRVPAGFALSAEAYWQHLKVNGLVEDITRERERLNDSNDHALLEEVSLRIRTLIMSVRIPEDVQNEIIDAYHQLSHRYNSKELCDVAVRSSATAEDLPHASFAGQQETFLNIRGEQNLLDACLRCMASLFTSRAIMYRYQQKIDDMSVGLSVGVQKMVRSDRSSSGVMFTLDPESGFKEVVNVTSSYGLGEFVVQGVVDPDEFVVHKPTLEKGFASVIRRFLGSKKQKLVYKKKSDSVVSSFSAIFGGGSTGIGIYGIEKAPHDALKAEPCTEQEQNSFSLCDDEVLELARYGILIEKHYSELSGRWMPMDIEWAKDGDDGKLYIVQARPETVHSQKKGLSTITTYRFSKTPDLSTQLAEGQAIGNGIVVGRARVFEVLDLSDDFEEGDILVTSMTDPDWVPLMSKAAAIVTNQGGRTCHAAIVSREMGIPAIIGTQNGTSVIVDGQIITVDCSSGSLGHVYDGEHQFKRTEVVLDDFKKPSVPIMLNIGNPDHAFRHSFLPVSGVGLARLEFIIASMIQVHPSACAEPDLVQDRRIKELINKQLGVVDPHQWSTIFVDLLAEGIGTLAAAFYPRPVIVRCSDFKSNEYRNLMGGDLFEPQEENPMLGFRGAARYSSQAYNPAFKLECRAFVKAREQFGLENIKMLIPFVRSVEEAGAVIDSLAKQGLERGKNNLEILMMVEIPSNVYSLESYAPYFDGFSLGSNDLAQLMLGVDRDSSQVSHLYDERNPSMKEIMLRAIEKAKKLGKPIGICGQAPSDFPELARFLIENGISSLSLVPDSVLSFFSNFSQLVEQD